MLAVSSLATYGILLAGLLKSPLIMKIINSKLDEFQELLKISRFEAKHILSVDIFYLLCIIIYSTFLYYSEEGDIMGVQRLGGG